MLAHRGFWGGGGAGHRSARSRSALTIVGLLTVLASACGSDDAAGLDPDTAPRAVIDRFSNTAGTMFKRSEDSSLPAAGAPVDFDQYMTRGLGPAGQPVSYYNFDVQSRQPAAIYVLFHQDAAMPVPGQLNIVEVRPGEFGYSDLWLVHRVTVPDDYTPNSVTSLAEILEQGFPIDPTTNIVNCPLVPEGSTATMRAVGDDTELHQAWFHSEIVQYFAFTEAPLAPVESGIFEGLAPISYIYVSFNINPGETGGGPASGAKTEAGTDQTHNLVETIPGDEKYSPLWMVYIYDNADFDTVTDITSAKAASILETLSDMVNCPVASVGSLAPSVGSVAAPPDPS